MTANNATHDYTPDRAKLAIAVEAQDITIEQAEAMYMAWRAQWLAEDINSPANTTILDEERWATEVLGNYATGHCGTITDNRVARIAKLAGYTDDETREHIDPEDGWTDDPIGHQEWIWTASDVEIADWVRQCLR